LCNINLNHLISNFENFKKISKQNTILVVSGFYKEDLDQVNLKLKNKNFDFLDFKEKNNWISSKYCYNLTAQ
jgi:ribosomal protein L11 methyltransferase